LLKERVLPVSNLRDDKELKKALSRQSLGLTPAEARKIAKGLGRDPTLVELHIFNVEWSEHCSYKSSRGTLKEFLCTSGPNVLQGIEEDAGIIYLTTIQGERYGIVIAHESHNHPSQVLPVEGAATGIGGIVRDVDCMGAEVIAVADPLRFGEPYGKSKERTRWIAGGVVDGIWQYGNALGIPNLAGDVVFSSSFDDNCLVNVVALGIIKEKDIIHSRVPKCARREDYDVILIGKPTDDSGFGGVAFASEILDEEKEKRGAVQIPDPFLKNVLLMGKANRQVFKRAKELGIEIGFKDLGGAGLACATSEIGATGGFGLEIDLDKVHLSMPNLLPEVICCAETQERYVLVVPRSFTKEVLKIYNQDWDLPHIYEGARARVIGKVIKQRHKGTKAQRHKGKAERYIVKHKGEVVCDAEIGEIVKGIVYKRKAKKKIYKEKEPEFPQPKDLRKVLLKILSSPNIASREYIYRFYDTEVQGNAVLRPGEADAGVIAPLPSSKVGVALSCDGNPFYGRISPYWGGATAVAEAMRNVACVGAVPSGLTDCLNFGNPEKEAAFWEFREGVRGLSEAAKKIGLKGYKETPVPIISGNVSFYNESAKGYAIDPSPIIACVGILKDYSKAITMQLKEAGNLIYLVGERYDELGGSAYYQEILGVNGRNVPKVRYEKERGMLYGVIDSINSGFVKSCHDISNGGMVVTICEMMMGGYAQGKLGVEIEMAEVRSEKKEKCQSVKVSECQTEVRPQRNYGLWTMDYGLRKGSRKTELREDKVLFSESGGFILEVPSKYASRLEKVFADYGVKAWKIGRVIEEEVLRIKGLGVVHSPPVHSPQSIGSDEGSESKVKGEKTLEVRLNELKKAWTSGLAEAMR